MASTTIFQCIEMFLIIKTKNAGNQKIKDFVVKTLKTKKKKKKKCQRNSGR